MAILQTTWGPGVLPETANMRPWRQAVAAASIIIVGGWLAWTAATSAVMAQADEGYRHFLLQLWPDAERMGVTRATFDRALLGVEPDRSLPDLVLPGQEVKGQPEFTRTPAQYLDADYLARLSEQGKALLKLNAAAQRSSRNWVCNASSCWRSGAAKPPSAATARPTT